MLSWTSRLIVPASLTYLHPVAAFVETLAEKQGFNKQEQMHISLALEEAFSNVVKHGFSGDADQTFEIRCQLNSMGLTVAIKEKGLPFDPERMPVYSPEQAKKKLAVAGLGTFLMNQMVDEVDYSNLGREGREIKFTKHLQRKRIENLLGEREEPLPESPPPVLEQEKVSYELRGIAGQDALEVSRCAYLSYGYSYEEYIYYPERIIEMNTQGLLKSVVVVDERGRFMAHMALKFKKAGDQIAESGVAFVKPEFRRLGLMGHMDQWLRQAAREMGLKGVFGRAVTSHVASQKMSAKQGYTECGIMLGNFPADVEFKKITGQVKQRETGVLSYQCLDEPPARRIYPPRRHVEIITTLFERLGVPVEIADGEHESLVPGGATHYSEEMISILNVVEIAVSNFGPGAAEEIIAMAKNHCLDRRDLIYLWLNLQDPGTPAVAASMEKAGFFFSGIMPFALQGKHALLLQYLNNVPLDYDQIKIASNQGRELLEYMKLQDPRG